VRAPDATGDAVGVVARFIEPGVAETFMDVLVSLKGTGVLSELIDFVAIVLDCKELAR